MADETYTPTQLNMEVKRLVGSIEPAPDFDPRVLSHSVGNILAEEISDFWSRFPNERWLKIQRPAREGDIATLRVRLRKLVQRDFPADELRVVQDLTRAETKDFLWVGREKPKRTRPAA